MKIVIIGDGKVGYKLAKQLSSEKYDIILIDNNEEKLRKSTKKDLSYNKIIDFCRKGLFLILYSIFLPLLLLRFPSPVHPKVPAHILQTDTHKYLFLLSWNEALYSIQTVLSSECLLL